MKKTSRAAVAALPVLDSAPWRVACLVLFLILVWKAGAEPLIPGQLKTGVLTAHTTQSYTVEVQANDSLVVRSGGVGFTPSLRLYGPDALLLTASSSSSLNNRDAEISFRPTNGGTFTVVLESYYPNGMGSFSISLTQSGRAGLISPGEEGGALTNGWRHTGTMTIGDLDQWHFTAVAGEQIILRVGGSNFTPHIRLFGPNGDPVAASSSSSLNNRDGEAMFRATNGGEYVVVLSSYYLNGSGEYSLHLAKTSEPLFIAPGDEGGAAINGWRHGGTLEVGDLDVWHFLAQAGENIVLRAGGSNFTPHIRLLGPHGDQVAASASSSLNNRDGEAVFRAVIGGEYVVALSSYYLNGNGDYFLHLAKTAGPLFLAPADEGGLLTNGWRHAGTLDAGDLDAWRFVAQAGENIILRAGGSTLTPLIRLFGPGGEAVAASASSSLNNRDGEAAFRATNGGMFTVVVSSYYLNGAGDYSLSLARAQGRSFISPADEGGAMAAEGNRVAALLVGDLDVWTFTACAGDAFQFQMFGTNFTPALRLYGPDGTLKVASTSSSVNTRTISLSHQATLCGTYVLVASSYYLNGSGRYRLMDNGLSDTMRLCLPSRIALPPFLAGVGGPAGAGFVLYRTLQVETPPLLWTPVLSNRFDSFGVFFYTNNPGGKESREFFRFVVADP